MIRTIALALTLVAIVSGLLEEKAGASNGYEQWVLSDDGQCGLYWDGYAYTLAGCVRSDGGYDVYLASYGQWVYTFSVGYLSDGSTWLYYQGQYYSDSPANGLYQSSMTIGAPSWSGLTGNILIDQILIDANNAMIDNILSPTCLETVGGVCYY
jgi:hypothetical protein